jgi:uncharacterized protein with HEPN domain
MLDAAREATSLTAGKSRSDLDRERTLALALVKLIEILGEAASRVTERGRQAHPAIPWRDIVAMRNRLIHGYFDIDLDRVWDTVTDDLPPLVAALEAALSSTGP